jgi:DMSO/TMAO reductase YedYZ molybdopterin-dependent catalytic subunit
MPRCPDGRGVDSDEPDLGGMKKDIQFTGVPMSDLMAPGVLLATKADGAPIPLGKGGPIRLVFPPDVMAGKNKDLWIWSIDSRPAAERADRVSAPCRSARACGPALELRAPSPSRQVMRRAGLVAWPARQLFAPRLGPRWWCRPLHPGRADRPRGGASGHSQGVGAATALAGAARARCPSLRWRANRGIRPCVPAPGPRGQRTRGGREGPSGERGALPRAGA